MNNAKVVVIGAGPSGIAASTKLLELGFQNIVIIEAESRIGGRINTIPFADNVIDLGAEWCHGEKNNVVYELASKQNLLETTGKDFNSYDCIRSNKEMVSAALSQRLKNIFNDILENVKVDLVNYTGSFGEYLNTKYFEELRKPKNSDIDMTIAKEFLENQEKIQNSVEGSDTLTDVSGKGILEYWDCEGDTTLNWKGKGYREILRLLMKSAEKGTELGVLNEHVMLGKSVKTIVWSDSSQKVQVKCEDDEVIEADHVITTVSLGVLQEKHMILYEPNLPAEKVRAIEGIAFGTVNKIFIEFPSQLWPNEWAGFSLLWREEDLKEIRGTNRAWLEDLFGFYPVAHQPKVMSGWIIGPHGRHMETLPEEDILNGCMYLLRKFLKWDIPTPLNFKTSAWFKNEHFRGSYSFRSMLTEKVNTGALDLAKPVTNSDQKPVLLFCGEASSEHHFSTVHGAVESGFREAERLAKFYDTSKDQVKLI